MNLTDSVEQPYRDLYVMHQALRRLGFSADDMYVGFQSVVGIGPDVLFVQLKTQDKHFTCSVAQLRDAARDEVIREWVRACEIGNDASDDELEAWRRHSPYGTESQFRALIGALAQRGFTIPALVEAGVHPGEAHEFAALIWGGAA